MIQPKQKIMHYIKRLVMIAILAFTVFASVSATDEVFKAKQVGDKPTGSDESVNGATQVTNVWSYDVNATNPSMWPTLGFPQCGGDMQSPINIDKRSTTERRYEALMTYRHYDDDAKTITVKNNGHTLEATFDYESADIRPSVSGGPLRGTYEFEQLHFHWDMTHDDKPAGSEHTLDGKRFAMEMHMVHRNVKYKTMAEAVNQTDGILVLASLFEQQKNNLMSLLESLEIVAHEVTSFHGSTTLKPRPLNSVLPAEKNNFFYYRGSLTTPGCQQSVDWIVFEHISHVLIRQISVLAKLKRENGKENLKNFRPTQELNHRSVFYWAYRKKDSAIGKSSAPHKLQAMSELYGILLALAALWKLSCQ